MASLCILNGKLYIIDNMVADDNLLLQVALLDIIEWCQGQTSNRWADIMDTSWKNRMSFTSSSHSPLSFKMHVVQIKR